MANGLGGFERPKLWVENMQKAGPGLEFGGGENVKNYCISLPNMLNKVSAISLGKKRTHARSPWMGLTAQVHSFHHLSHSLSNFHHM